MIEGRTRAYAPPSSCTSLVAELLVFGLASTRIESTPYNIPCLVVVHLLVVLEVLRMRLQLVSLPRVSFGAPHPTKLACAVSSRAVSAEVRSFLRK